MTDPHDVERSWPTTSWSIVFEESHDGVTVYDAGIGTGSGALGASLAAGE